MEYFDLNIHFCKKVSLRISSWILLSQKLNAVAMSLWCMVALLYFDTFHFMWLWCEVWLLDKFFYAAVLETKQIHDATGFECAYSKFCTLHQKCCVKVKQCYLGKYIDSRLLKVVPLQNSAEVKIKPVLTAWIKTLWLQNPRKVESFKTKTNDWSKTNWKIVRHVSSWANCMAKTARGWIFENWALIYIYHAPL